MEALFLGYGRMAVTLGQAWLARNLLTKITAVDPLVTQPIDSEVCLYQNAEALRACEFDFIIVAVKPELVPFALADLANADITGKIVISIAAGVSVGTIASIYTNDMPIVRAMPNTPAMLGAGCTCLYSEGQITEAHKQIVTSLFQALGKVLWLRSEEMVDAATAISGSGPAYYHLFSEYLAATARDIGFSLEEADTLVSQTAYGASLQQIQPGNNFAELRNAVTSPGGTTAAAIEVFIGQARLQQLISEAVIAAFARARVLGKSR